tara:strand:- start:7644 stop:7988 length:345 start_codon:yes stop_codon:yes gene_type:complete
MQTQIKEYIRDEVTKQPRGIVVAVKVEEEVLYGYSLLNTKLDKFNKTVGLDIALNRANAKEGYNLPDTQERLDVVVASLMRVQDRALKYFKDLDPQNVTLTFNFPTEDIVLTEE